MRTIPVSQITDAVKEMCIEANLFLTKDMEEALKQAQKSEEAPLGHSVLDQLCPESSDRRRGFHSDLSGYGNGGGFSGSGTGGSF